MNRVSELELYAQLSHRENQSYQCVGKRNLVELHLVDAGLGRAQKRGGSEKSTLHDGQSGRECDQVMSR